MPKTPTPVGRRGPFGAHWNAILSALQGLQQQVNGLVAGAQQTNVVDQYGNTTVVIGQLNQTVTIGANFQQAGVQVGTALAAPGAFTPASPNAGIAVQQGLKLTTITLTKGSTSATVASGAGLVNGMSIGAANVSDPSSGIATPAITPGTTISAGGGTTSLTLSQNAAESGAALYCAACSWFRVGGVFGVATLPNSGALTAAVTVTHGLGRTPVSVFTQLDFSAPEVNSYPGSVGATTFVITGVNTVNITSTGKVYWLALG